MIYNKSSSVDNYIKNLITDVVPRSDLFDIPINSSGLRMLNNSNCIYWPVELPDSVEAGLYAHEKCSTTRYGIFVNPNASKILVHSYYVKPFHATNIECFQKLVAQSVLYLYPTPITTHGAVVDPEVAPIISGAVVDLNHLKTQDGGIRVPSIRLDMFLKANNFEKEINSFMDLQKLLKDPNITKKISERALVQIALCSYFIPNAIGEVDANSRNIILLADPRTGKYEYAARIDAESNTYFNDINGERSGKSILPKGIKKANEPFHQIFLKTIKEKDTDVDWDLFSSLLSLTSAYLKNTKVDEDIFQGYKDNYMRVPDSERRKFSVAERYFSMDAYGEFAGTYGSEKEKDRATIARKDRFINNTSFALGGRYKKEFPFAEEMEKSIKPEKFEMQDFDLRGKEVEREME